MIVFPNSKINLGLHVLRKREDGFHDLETIFYPLPLTDALEIIHRPIPGTDVTFSASGLKVEGTISDNICVKAYRLLKNDFPELAPITMHLHKTIPMGAGLGGGSADGAFALTLLNRKFNLGLTRDQLIQYALQLGSDCPFFIYNTPCYATGRGEVLEAVELDLSRYRFAIVHPGIHVNTGWAFSRVQPSADHLSLRELIRRPVEEWKDRLINDFEAPVGRHHPEIQAIKQALYEQGGHYAAMTGSGSTVYGIFPKDAVPQFSFPSHYFVKMI